MDLSEAVQFVLVGRGTDSERIADGVGVVQACDEDECECCGLADAVDQSVRM